MPGGRRSLSLSSAVLLAVLTVGYAAYATDRTVLSSVLKPMSASLHLTNAQVGLLGAAQFIGVLAVVQLAGSLSDRYGRRRIILLGLVVFSSFTWLVGYSTTFYEAFGYRLVSGVGEGLFWPVAMAAVAARFGGRKGLALGVFYVGFDAGSIAGLSVGGFTYALSGAWNEAFFYAPLLGVIPIAGILLFRGEYEEPAGRMYGISRAEAAQLLRDRGVQLLMLFALLATWASVWQTVFLPYYFASVLHTTVLSAALLSAAVTAAGAAGKIALGGASDRLSKPKLIVAASAATSVLYVAFFFASSLDLSFALALSMGFFSASVFPMLQSQVTEVSKGRLGTALGLTTTSQSIATVFSTVIAGYLLNLGVGRGLAFDAITPALLMTVVGLLMVRVLGRRAPDEI